MTEYELIKTVLAIKQFHPPDGVELALVVRPKPGVCRVSVEMWAGQEWRECRLKEPPTEDGLRALYSEAVDVLASSQTKQTSCSILGLDAGAIGGDQ